MPLCQINIKDGAVVGPADCAAQLRRALRATPEEAPVIILIHGYKFSPFIAARSPHRHILSLDPRPCWKAVSWPRKLGLGQNGADEPVVIALGWNARGTLWQAYRRAAETGGGLAQLVDILNGIRPGIAVQILAHSLGARVALSTLPHLEPGQVRRIILLAAAELRSRAAACLECRGGRGVEVLNVRSGENAFFDRMMEWLVAPHASGDRSLAQGLARPSARWIDLTVDDASTRAALLALGYTIPAPDRQVCHWSVYLRSGLFDVYRAVFAQELTFYSLALHLPRAAPQPRRRCTFRRVPLPLLRRGAS